MNTEERLRKIVDYLGISVRQFEMGCQLGNGYVNNAPKILNEKKANQIIGQYPFINKHWLMTGNGNMLLDDISEQGVSLFPDSEEKSGSTSESQPLSEEKEWKKIIDRLIETNARLTCSNERLVAMNQELLSRLLKNNQ